MNDENLERDRATQVYSRRLVPPRYTPEGDSPLSLYATVLSSRVVVLRQQTPGWREGNGPGGAGPRGVLVWHLQEFPTGPTGTSSQSEQQQRSDPQEGGRSRTSRDFLPSAERTRDCTRPLLQPRGLKFWLCVLFLAAPPHRLLWSVSVVRGVAVLSVSYDSCRRPEEPRRYRRVQRCIARQRARVVPRQRHVGAAPLRDKFGGLERHVIHPCPGCSRSSQLSRSSPGRLGQRVLSEERGKCYSPRPFCGYSRTTPRDASHYSTTPRNENRHF